MNLSKGFLLALVFALLALSIAILQPYLPFVLAAVLLAFVLRPVQTRLEEHTSSTVAAFSLVVLTVVGFVAPFAVVVRTVADSARRILGNLDTDSVQFQTVETRIEEFTGWEVDLAGELASASEQSGSFAFEQSAEVLGTLTHLVVGLALALFLLFYLLKDRDDMLAWLHRTIPLPGDIQRDLHREIDHVVWGVLFGHVFVAVVQGIVAGLGFFATGVPNSTFWTAVMIVFAMIPLVGTIPIWGGAVVFLYLTNRPLLAVALFVYCVVVVGLTDDYLRPLAVDRYAELSPAVILLGILGGVSAFGVMGLFFGPIVLGALKASLAVVTENWDQLDGTDAR